MSAIDAVDVSSIGIAMCGISVSIFILGMTACDAVDGSSTGI